MLSIENPPLDPRLISTNVDRINASSQIQVVVDLCRSDFDNNPNNNTTINPPPRFSIRDYVCSARSKNIATNWPFSEKNLQLCRKHGVTDLLPPFQSLDSVREQSVKGCAVNHNLLDIEDLSNPDEKTTRQSHQYEPIFVNGASCNQKLNLDCLHITSSVTCQGEGEIPFEVEQFNSKKDTEAAFLLDSSTKQVAGAILPETCKTGIKIQRQPSVKKSKVILKLGTSAGTSTKEGTTNSFNMVSEIMGSKVCPICKTFLSSSNTTLNAHIDQCLSGESTMKWSADPRVVKHRIKPRKMRSMMDIYATAEHCTLEDLDRRNGTNWTINPTPIYQSGELCVKERVGKMQSGGIEDTGHEEGEVYIDTNGKKVRILSKFSEAATVDWITRAQKRHKGSKLLIDKKQKKPYVLKHQKFLKLAPHGKPCSSKPHPTLETSGGSSRNIAVDQPSEKEVKLGECSKGQEPIKLDDSGIIKQWAGSKRTGLTKKIPREDNHQHSGHNLKDLVGERDQSSLSNSYAGSNCILNRQQSSKDLVSSKSSRRIESSSNEPRIGLCRVQPPLKRKREESYLSCNGKRSMILQKHKKLRNEGTALRDSSNSSLYRAASGSSSLRSKAAEINTTPTRTSDSFVFVSKSSCRHKAFSSKGTKFTSVDGEEFESEDILALGNHVAIGKTVKEGIRGSFKSSSNSLDPEFDELPSSSGESKSEHYAEVNQRHSRGHLVSPTEPSDNGKQELLSADRVGHVMIGEDIHMEAQLYSKDEQVNYFYEVDPIPIPGPPGFFLPSPRQMGSEDLQGNSSLTTCKIQFTEDQHDNVERDKSDSLTSASSDISNPASAISESRSSKSFSVEPLAIHNEIIEGYAGAGQVLQAAKVGAELPSAHILRINVNFPEKTPVSSKSEQLCCCSRKEGVQGVPLDFHESQLPRRRIISSLPFPEKNMGHCYERLSNMNSRSEMFSLSNYPTSGSGTLFYPLRKSVSEQIDKNFSAEHEFNFSSHQRDHDSASPSASTPVLRLMGKNLMVLNKDEDVFLQHRQNHSNSMNPQPHLQPSTFTEFSPGGVGSKDYHSYHQLMFAGLRWNSMSTKVEVACLVNNKEPKTDLIICRHMGLEKSFATIGAGVGPPSSGDIIIIDDAIGMMCNEDMRKTPVSLNGNSVLGASDLSSRVANRIYSNALEGAGSMYGRQPVLNNTSFQLRISDGNNATPVKWNCNPEGVSLLSPSTFISWSTETYILLLSKRFMNLN